MDRKGEHEELRITDQQSAADGNVNNLKRSGNEGLFRSLNVIWGAFDTCLYLNPKRRPRKQGGLHQGKKKGEGLHTHMVTVTARISHFTTRICLGRKPL